MPALWQSSQRPMYVRTVWVDGFRHAILSHDDPYYLKLNARKHRPHSSATCTTNSKSLNNRVANSRLSQHDDELEHCLRKLNLVIKSDRLNIVNTQRPRSHHPDVEKLNLVDVDPDSEEETVVDANLESYDLDSSSKFDRHCINMRSLRNRTSRSEVKDNTDLSDRVLQWLDLAGKVDLLAPENVERMAQPRHSWPEIQKKNLRKSKTTVDVGKESKSPSPKVSARQQSGIDRHDFYVPTSANTIENYARQSRNVRSTPRYEITKTKQNTTKSKEIRTNVVEARQKMITERNAVEKQYAEMLNKKLIPDLGKQAKRQVHIFMPDLPKKVDSNTTSRAESLLSQKNLYLN